jgi:hypothetical protein
MRTLLLSLVMGTACLGLLAPGRADHDHSTPPASKKPAYSAKTSASPSARLIAEQPRIQPYRSTSYFPNEPPARPRPDQVRDVSLFDNYFSPSYLMIPAGMTVRWKNEGSHHHSTTADWLWESGDLGRGKSFSLTFTRRGTYYYYCRLHPRDMRGVIVVY